LDNPLYHVLLDGRRVGPYDRRTIVGMRMKKALNSAQVLEGSDGTQLTVAQLVHGMQPADAPEPVEVGLEAAKLEPDRSGSHSGTQGLFPATLLEVQGSGYAIPAFKGEVELRLQTPVLRLAGRVREGLVWQEDRVKFPLLDIAHARLRGKVVDLWIRSADHPGLQRVSLELASPAAAGEMAEGLPHTAPWPGSEPLARPLAGKAGALHPMLWVALLGGALLVGCALLVWSLARRF
jgi:hypothetical protein